MGFKEDADFARFVSMGAVGAAAVAHDLSTEHGHTMIELERYAMANKVWQTKVKRLRMPDLLCVGCGLRVEARAKSKLGIVLSHSDTPGREWDAGGMRNQDLYAFLRADLDTFPPRTGPPTYFTTQALRSTVKHARRSEPKAASEGSEVTLKWPYWVPSGSGTFIRIDDQGRIVHRDARDRERVYWQWRRWGGRGIAYLGPNDRFEGGDTIVAGIAPRPESIDCPGEVWDLVAAVGAIDEVDRYAGVKAAGVIGGHEVQAKLIEVLNDRDVDWRVRLEAASSLVRLDGARWADAIRSFISDQAATEEQRMEAVLAASEVPLGVAADILYEVASDSGRPPELRAAAAWGLGQGQAAHSELLLELVLDDEELVALHAIAAIEGIPESAERVLVDWLNDRDEMRGDRAAHLLARHQRIGLLLDAHERGGRARIRALSALGGLPRETVLLVAGNRLTNELAELLAPMWYRQENWTQTTGHDGLEALEVQKIRFNPMNPSTPWATGLDWTD